MLTNYIRLAIRTFLRNKASFAINLIGMSIALGCCITAYVNFDYNMKFDKQQQSPEKIYRVSFWQRNEHRMTPYGVCPIPVGNLIRENLKDGEQVVQYFSKGSQFRIGDEMFQKEVVYADAVFTKVFTMSMITGSSDLDDKGNILISDKLALNYFGRTQVVGEPMTQIISGEPKEFVITGVYKAFPANSSFRFDVLTSYENYFADPATKTRMEGDWSRWATTFLVLNNRTSADGIEKQLQQYIKTQNDARPDLKAESFFVESFVGMSARANEQKNQGHWLNRPMPPAAVVAPFVMAGLLLLVACFNYMNNTIAVAGNRLKEIGIRKVIGGKRKELIFQFLSETFVFCLMALVISLVLAEYFTAGWNGMWSGIEIQISYRDNVTFFLVLTALVLFTAVLAGAYPAFYVSRFRPIEILRGTTRFGDAGFLSKCLLVFQFSISLAAVIFAFAFYFNSTFQKTYDIGYSWRSVVQVPLDNPRQFELLRNELASNNTIKSIGGSQNHIYSNSYTAAVRIGNTGEKEVDMLNVGDGYFETLNIRLLQGRNFQKDQVSDEIESIVVNEEFVRKFNLGSAAVGTRVLLNDSVQVYITGIVKDVYLAALFQPLSAVAFRYVPSTEYKYFVASANAPDDLVAAEAEVKTAWKKLFPQQVYPGKLMEASMMMALEHFDSVVILYSFLGLVAIIMSVSGLYSLVALNLQKRTKEFGIRKVLGAPIKNIVFNASGLFLIIMMISFILGTLMGSVMVNKLMGSVWEYYEAVDTKVIMLAITVLFTIAVGTIGFRIRKVATTNPVESLRYE